MKSSREVSLFLIMVWMNFICFVSTSLRSEEGSGLPTLWFGLAKSDLKLQPFCKKSLRLISNLATIRVSKNFLWVHHSKDAPCYNLTDPWFERTISRLVNNRFVHHDPYEKCLYFQFDSFQGFERITSIISTSKSFRNGLKIRIFFDFRLFDIPCPLKLTHRILWVNIKVW